MSKPQEVTMWKDADGDLHLNPKSAAVSDARRALRSDLDDSYGTKYDMSREQSTHCFIGLVADNPHPAKAALEAYIDALAKANADD